MNIRGGSKHRIDRKKLALKREFCKEPADRDSHIIKRLQESISRNKDIDHYYKRKHNKRKISEKNKKK